MLFKIPGHIIDCTRLHSAPADFVPYLLAETEIGAEQVTAFKVSYHRQFLAGWLPGRHPRMHLDRLWSVREQCIRDLSAPA